MSAAAALGHDRATGAGPGRTHGTISCYMAGCREECCRRVARERRAYYRKLERQRLEREGHRRQQGQQLRSA